MEDIIEFRDCESLSLSKKDIDILIRLHELSLNDGVEHAAAIINDDVIQEFTSGFADKVYIPEEVRNTRTVRLFHSHTIETPLSPSDLTFLIAPGIDEVCVITKNRSVFRVLVNGGIKPDEREYIEQTEGLDDIVNFEIMDHPGFIDWDIDFRNYMATMEQLFRTVRLFKWRLEGGRI